MGSRRNGVGRLQYLYGPLQCDFPHILIKGHCIQDIPYAVERLVGIRGGKGLDETMY